MGLYITAGVLVYALALYFVYWTCSAARTYSRFYETVMAPENDESRPEGRLSSMDITEFMDGPDV